MVVTNPTLELSGNGGNGTNGVDWGRSCGNHNGGAGGVPKDESEVSAGKNYLTNQQYTPDARLYFTRI